MLSTWFRLNGNYGIATFRGVAGEYNANPKILIVDGETRRQALERLDAELKRIDDARLSAQGLFGTLTAALGAGSTYLVTTVLLGGLPIAAAAGALLAIATALAVLYVLVVFYNEAQRRKETLKERTLPLVEMLPE